MLRLLHQIVHDAGFAILIDAGDDAAQFCLRQYNEVCVQLKKIRPSLGDHVSMLPENATPGQVRIAARDLAARIGGELREDAGKNLLGCLFPPVVHFFRFDAIS